MALGRRGEGPGEFSANAFFGIHPLKNGDVAVDDIPFQLEIFDNQGAYKRSVDLRMLPITADKQGYWNSSVRWVLEDRIIFAWRHSAFGEPSHHWFLYVDEDLETQTWIDAGITPPSVIVDGPSFYSIPFPAFLEWTLTGENVLVWCVSHNYQLMRHDLANDSWMHIIFELQPTPFTRRDREDYIAREIEDLPEERRATRETTLRRMPYPNYFPQITEILGDDEGNIWVCRYIAEPWRQHPEGFRYDLFDGQGEWQGVVDTPRLFDIIQGGYAYTNGWEEFPTIERYRIVNSDKK